MNDVHMVLQGKGGVGKSLTAVLLAQYLLSKGNSVFCADTDPVNATFAQYKTLDVAHVEIAQGVNILQSKFDPLMVSILGIEADCVIDNGAATFLPLTKYLSENDIFQLMDEGGKTVYIHTVLTGGQAKTDTYNGFAELLRNVNQHAKVVVWENEYFGKVEYDGHSIRQTKLYSDAVKAGKIAGVVKIEDRSQSDAFVEDMKAMTSSHMTLADVQASPDFNFLRKNRLAKVVNGVFNELDSVQWAD